MKQVIAIRDVKAGCFLNPPMFAVDTTEAARQFAQIAVNPNSVIYQYPDEFELWLLGTWDEIQGRFSMLEQFQMLTNAIRVTKPKQKEIDRKELENEKN